MLYRAAKLVGGREVMVGSFDRATAVRDFVCNDFSWTAIGR